MYSFSKNTVRYSKSQRIGFLIFLVMIVVIELNGFIISKKIRATTEIPFEVSLLTVNKNQDDKQQGVKMVEFDPNELDAKDWQQFGFSEKQSATIIKYKYSLGGYFSSKEQLKDCFVISERKFNELEPFIVFGEIKIPDLNSSQTNFSNKPVIRYKKFNPNNYSQKDWQNIGFTEKQATSILKYKKSLGGSFESIDQIKKCFMISDEKFVEMKPYIVLPVTKSSERVKSETKTEGSIRLAENEDEKTTSDVFSIKLLTED